MNNQEDILSGIYELRHKLHKHPELSNSEYNTSKLITDFLLKLHPDKVLHLSSTGKALIFKGKQKGKTLVFRAELDALPIDENTGLSYSSVNSGIAHSCGHDGHMAIIAGLAKIIADVPPEKGQVVLLFQPAEEMEQGAKVVVESKEFRKLNPDYVFALHNIPGEEKNTIILKSGVFAAASKGMIVKLIGKTAHAAEPEKGISPAFAISKIIQQLHNLAKETRLFSGLTLLTIVHIKLGEPTFGTSPGNAEIMVTLRTFENSDMLILTGESKKIIRQVSHEENLEFEISYTEEFPATVNNGDCLKLVEYASGVNMLEVKYRSEPFKWSEDFAYYTQKYKACLFGLGAGTSHPSLHQENYDFPDDIIKTGVNMFYSIYKQICF